MKKYNLTMINRNGYTITHESNTVEGLKRFAKFYPIEVFFCWIYDRVNDEIVCQNDYRKRFFKCNNKTFIPYWS